MLPAGCSKNYIETGAYFKKLSDIFKTSSNQRLWECVRRRNFNTDTLND